MTHGAAWQGRPLWAEIDLDAIAFNTRVFVERARGAQVYGVVKANAYGHGAVPVARAAVEAGAAGVCVVSVDEGLLLRKAGLQCSTIVLGAAARAQAEDIVSANLTPAVHSVEMAEALSAACRKLQKRISIHLEVETGLNRHGFTIPALVEQANLIRALPGLTIEGLFTHFAAAEEGDKTFTRSQHERLVEAHAALPFIPMRHCAATASVLDTPEFSHQLVRVGLGLYGYHPAARCGADVPLRRALSLKSRIARILPVEPGATVGYGRTWRAERAATIALLMCGYADGFPRRLSGRAQVLIRGERAPVVGRIAMDMCMVDVTSIPAAQLDDEAVIIGAQGDDRIDADDLASLGETISWEILAGISHRVPRVYLREGKIVETTTLVDR